MRFKILLIVALILVACRKYPIDEVGQKNPTPSLEEGMFVLNEGLFQHNNATLQFFPKNGSSYNYFEQVLGRPLGDTGNDMKAYGEKLYIVVNVSSTLEVMDLKSGKSVKQISMTTANGPKQPRFLAFYEDLILVTCYDGYVDVYDTNLLHLQRRVKVGANPEGISIFQNQAYVANSGGLNFPNVDSTMSIIDLQTWSERKVVVGLNPGQVVAADNGRIFVIARGDYASVSSQLKYYDPSSDQVYFYADKVSAIEKMKGQMLVCYEGSGNKQLALFQPELSFSPQSFLSLTDYTTFYGVQYSSNDELIYTFDARGYVNTGLIRTYNLQGDFLASFETQIIPTAIYYHVP